MVPHPDLWSAIQLLQKSIAAGGVDPKRLAMVHLRAGQINGCSACVHAGVAGGKRAGDTDERLHNVAVWREAAPARGRQRGTRTTVAARASGSRRASERAPSAAVANGARSGC
ncbi:carboxymuconolactone decarboxylase family protein [Streptomyces massasporeus]